MNDDLALGRGALPAQQIAATLRRYRAGRRDLDEPARIAAKRELMKLVPPALRDRLRSI